MYMLRAKPWARTRGVEEHTSLEHIVVRAVCTHTKTSVHCTVHIQGAVCAHTKTSVHTYKDQWVHIHGAVCALHIHGALCAHTQVEIVVVWTSDGADVVLSLGRGSETG